MKHNLPRNITSGPNEETLAAFGIHQKPTLLTGGEGRVFQAGDKILKHLNKDSIASTSWISEIFNDISPNEFRVAKPIRAKDGSWLTNDWAAWTKLAGDPSTPLDVKAVIPAITKFHIALSAISEPDFLAHEDTPYKRADAYAWGDMPTMIHPLLKKEVVDLYSLRLPISSMPNQLIHGDINPENVLIQLGQPPAIIDLAPYWRPAHFAQAIYAYWVGPWNNKPELLNHFAFIPDFPQLLIRAAIRMLLIMSEFDKVFELPRYQKTTRMVLDYCARHAVSTI